MTGLEVEADYIWLDGYRVARLLPGISLSLRRDMEELARDSHEAFEVLADQSEVSVPEAPTADEVLEVVLRALEVHTQKNHGLASMTEIEAVARSAVEKIATGD